MNAARMITTDECYVEYCDDISGYHRSDGPARIWKDCCADGSFNYQWQYIQNGQLHRTDGPAWKTGASIRWYKHSSLHNLNGPACMSWDDTLGLSVTYQIDGQSINLEDFKKQYLMTHLEEYKPQDDIKVYEYWKSLDLSHEFLLDNPSS